MRKLMIMAFVVSAALGVALDVAGQQSAGARVVVRLPADAKLYFGDTLTTQTGGVRSFTTPALEPGRNYSYQLKVEVVRQGQVQSQSQTAYVKAGETTEVDFTNVGATYTAVPLSSAPAPSAGDGGWPRKLAAADGSTVTVYQPQVEKWEQVRLEARAAVSIETKANPQPTYGVVWLSARTDVDKEQRLVTLHDFQVSKVNFPSLPDKGQSFEEALRKKLPQLSQTVSLDRLQANLAVTQAEMKTSNLPLKNDPPKIIYSTQPAVLVLIDGQPSLRQVVGTNLLRVINTRALVLLDEANGKYYLHLMDRWMGSNGLDGPWTVVDNPPAALQTALTAVSGQVDLLDELSVDLKAELADGKLPAVYVSTVPAELIHTQGEPQMAPIDGTQLLWAKNSSDEVILDTTSQDYYVLVSGRWFRSKSLAKGPWEYVGHDKLPADFAKIPENHPKGDVLVSVAGTPQAKELAIAHSVPQTATIKRSEAKLAVSYDGQPKFEPVEGTTLHYAANSPTAVFQTDAKTYYAVENGVWFTALNPGGPWSVATSVPQDVYTIPPSSPVYYASNVYVYDSTPDTVNVGYTPGYFGTCLDPTGCVVYGTGWNYPPWIGTAWYGRPWSYGWGARFGWWGGGWGWGFGGGGGWPWWGPLGWHAGWGGNWWRPGWEHGWGGRYDNIHGNHVNINNFNAYNRWGDNARVTHPRTAPIGPRTTSLTPGSAPHGLNNVYAGHDGNVYRPAANGWEQHTGQGWQQRNAADLQREQMERMQREMAARREAEFQHNQFHSTGGFGGYRGPVGGFHGGGGRGGRR